MQNRLVRSKGTTRYYVTCALGIGATENPKLCLLYVLILWSQCQRTSISSETVDSGSSSSEDLVCSRLRRSERRKIKPSEDVYRSSGQNVEWKSFITTTTGSFRPEAPHCCNCSPLPFITNTERSATFTWDRFFVLKGRWDWVLLSFKIAILIVNSVILILHIDFENRKHAKFQFSWSTSFREDIFKINFYM